MSTVYENMPAQRQKRYEQAKGEIHDIFIKYHLPRIDAAMLLESIKFNIIYDSFETEIQI